MAHTNTAIDDFQAVSPFQELAAYEALWAQTDASVKTVAAQFRHGKTYLPSELLSSQNIQVYIEKLREKFKSHYPFEICLATEVDFPKKILEATHPIPFLYYKGNWDLIYSPAVAVVGTRQPTQEGLARTQKLTKLLVEQDFTIVSGLAKGIDTCAHHTAIEAGGNTIAVIGTPITECYPKENQALQDKIAQSHLLVSQVPFFKYMQQDFRLNRFFFPERNKTMSAISLATVIIEAGETSGTLVQAREALRQGRKLFILDNCFHNTALTWPARFEKQGAIRVKAFSDILRHL
ncbi:MAG: DNA-processing protein DprA [Pseudomonadota bacterium]